MTPVLKRQVLIVLLALVHGTCFAAIKFGLDFAPPLLFGGMRALIAGLALFVVIVGWRQPLLPSRASWPWVLCLAAVSTTLALGAMFLSPGRTSAGIASVLGNL